MKLANKAVRAHGAWRTAAGALALAVLAVTGQAHAQATASGHPSLLRALNLVRQQGCEGHPGPPTSLHESAQLSDAAALIAAGNKVDAALRAAGYRAVQAAQIALRGYTGDAALARGAIGSSSSSCNTITNGELTEVGFHQRGPQTWIVLAAPFSPPGVAQAGDVQAHVLALVNEARATPRRCGDDSFAATHPVRLNATLQSVATAHAQDMARYNYFSHTGHDGSHVDGRASRAGYHWHAIGENIAAGQMQADAAVQGWLSSPGHCVNIMSPAFTEMGAAFAVNSKSSEGIYWVQVFGDRH